MRITAPQLEIGPDEGFAPEKDIFKRREFGEALANLLIEVEENTIVALDAPWGEGKTTFIRMWEGHLRSKGVPVIRFDAFANDYHVDAFAALAGEIIAYADLIKSSDKVVSEGFKRAALNAGLVLTRAAVKIGVRVATAGALDAAELNFAGDAPEITGEVANAAERLLKDRLEHRTRERATFETFRRALAELAVMLSKEEQPVGRVRPLVIIIDELDRCKPTYALELLEAVKHFFSVEGVHFVFSLNMEQLEASVRCAYGADVPASSYLQKFYTLRVRIPASTDFAMPNVAIYVEHLAETLASGRTRDNGIKGIARTVAAIAEHRGFSLRSADRILAYAAVSAGFAVESRSHRAIVAILCVLRVDNHHLYRKAASGQLTFNEAREYLGFNHWTDDRSIFVSEAVEYLTEPDVDISDSRWTEYRRDLGHHNRLEILRNIVSRVIDRFVLT